MTIKKIGVNWYEKQKSRIKRKGARSASDGRLRKHRRYSGKTEKLFAGTIEQMLEVEMALDEIIWLITLRFVGVP